MCFTFRRPLTHRVFRPFPFFLPRTVGNRLNTLKQRPHSRDVFHSGICTTVA